MRTPGTSRPIRQALALAGCVAAFGAIAGRAPVARAAVRPQVVRMEGVLGAKALPAALDETVLLVGRTPVKFAVTAVRRLTPTPEEGIGILMPMGPGVPRIRLIGPKRLLAALRDAPPGTPVVLLGNLNTSQRLYQVFESSLAPAATPVAEPLSGASGPRE